MTTTFKLGKNGKLYIGSEGDDLSALTEMGGIKDPSVPMEAAEADNTFRDNGGWDSTVAGNRKLGIEFIARWKTSDANFQALKNAYLTGGLVRLAALTGEKSPDGITPVPGSDGPMGDFSITNFSRSEPQNEIITCQVTAKLTTFDCWVEEGMVPA